MQPVVLSPGAGTLQAPGNIVEDLRDFPSLAEIRQETSSRKRKAQRTELCTYAQEVIMNVSEKSVALMGDPAANEVTKTVVEALNGVTKVLGMVIEFFQEESKCQGNETAAAKNQMQAAVAVQSLQKRLVAQKPLKEKKQQKPQKQQQSKLPQKQQITLTQEPEISNPWLQVAKKRIIGNRKDTVKIIVTEETALDAEPVELLSAEEIKKLTREPRVPQTIEVASFRFTNMPTRKHMTAKDWRNKLQEHQIAVNTVLFPSWGTIEIVAPKSEETKIQRFFKSINRVSEDTQFPYLIRNTLTEEKKTESLIYQIRNRIQMMGFERSIVGLRYLEQTAVAGISKTRPLIAGMLTQELSEKMKSLKI